MARKQGPHTKGLSRYKKKREGTQTRMGHLQKEVGHRRRKKVRKGGRQKKRIDKEE